MALEHPVRVRGLGLDARFRSMLDVFFTRSGRGSYTFSDEIADLIVVDMDALGAREEYTEYQSRNRDLPAILFSLSDRDLRTRGKTILLRKPFTVRQLQSAFEILTIRYLGGIPVPVDKPFDESQAVAEQRQKVVRETVEEERERRIRERAEKQQAKKEREQERQEKWNRQKQEKLNRARQQQAARPEKSRKKAEIPRAKAASKKAGTSKAASSLSRQESYVKLDTLMSEAPAGKGTSSDEVKEYLPADYLQAKLLDARKKALKQKKNAVIRLGSGMITIDPRQELAQVRMGDYQLREMSSFALKKEDFRLELVPEKVAPINEDARGRVVSLRSLVWKSALYAARGRVPAGTDIEAPLQLQRWPNLTRLMLVPGAVRISALWTSQAVTIRSLAQQLNLPLHDVASFYSAAHALDLFVAAGEIKPAAIQKKPASRQGGIFRRILKRLKAFT